MAKSSGKDMTLCPRPPLQPPAVCTSSQKPPALVRRETRRMISVRRMTNDKDCENLYDNILVQENIYTEMYDTTASPPPLPPPVDQRRCGPDELRHNPMLDAKYLKEWWKRVESWEYLAIDLSLQENEESKNITNKAQRIYKAIQVFHLLLAEHGVTFQGHIFELNAVADNLDKVSKGTKIAGITGGATSAIGGLAVVAGLIFSPFTAGASLALTAVGVGVVTAGGVTGASAAIANTVNKKHDKKKIKQIFQDYEDKMAEIQRCLEFVNEGLEALRQHPQAALEGLTVGPVTVARLAELGAGSRTCSSAIESNSKASGVMQGLALGMDMYFNKVKKVKKKLRSEFANRMRIVVEQLVTGLEMLKKAQEAFVKFTS